MSRCLATLALIPLLAAPTAAADPTTFWLQFPGSFPLGSPVQVQTADGMTADVTVQTGGTRGVSGADLGAIGQAETGLDYSTIPVIAIFNGGGVGVVPTTITFSNIQVGASHLRGLLLVGCVNENSSPVIIGSSVAGRVATWTVVGSPFDYTPSNSWPISWDPATGQLATNAQVGVDSRCIVLDLGDLDSDGTVTIALEQHLNDGIVFSFGVQRASPVAVPTLHDGRGVTLARPFPNPVHASASLGFHLARASAVELAAYDVTGSRLATLAQGRYPEGTHTLRWDLKDDQGRRIPPGLVFLQLDAAGERRTGRLLVTR